MSLSLSIRSVQPGDYPIVARLFNAQNEPDFHTTPERLRDLDVRSAQSDPAFRRLVVESNGCVIATGDFRYTWAGEARRGRCWARIHVQEDYRHRGVDASLLRQALEETSESVREVWTCIREDFVPAAGFLEVEGFEERFRSWGSHLDLAAFEPSRFSSLTQALERQGVRLVGYRDLARDPHRDRRLLKLQRALEQDVLAHEPIIPRRHPDVTSPETVLGATVIALGPDGTYVGLASLTGNRNGPNFGCGFVGVIRAYRDRGIATALLARTTHIARDLGGAEMNAGGGGRDTPMMRVVRKLGFEIEPAWITFASRPFGGAHE